jgi:hypothetical protein
LTRRTLIFMLITRHYTYHCIKLMPYKEVFYAHFPFSLHYLHNNTGKVSIT